MELNDILKIRRTELNLTQKEVADYVGVSEATLSRWESGEIKNLKRNRIAALAKILKLPPSTIVGTLDEEEQIYTIAENEDDWLIEEFDMVRHSQGIRDLIRASKGLSEDQLSLIANLVSQIRR